MTDEHVTPKLEKLARTLAIDDYERGLWCATDYWVDMNWRNYTGQARNILNSTNKQC